MAGGDRSFKKDEELGAYSFTLNKKAAVERSLGRIRHSLGDDWRKLHDDEIQSLEWALGEAWAVMDFYEWDSLNLSAIDLETADKLIDIGRRGRGGKITSPAAATTAARILTGLSRPGSSVL